MGNKGNAKTKGTGKGKKKNKAKKNPGQTKRTSTRPSKMKRK
jgi:hypothetical protein